MSRITINMPDEMLAGLRAEAARRQVTVAALIRDALAARGLGSEGEQA